MNRSCTPKSKSKKEKPPLQCCQEHGEVEQLFLCNDLLFQLLLCHSELHIVVEILQFHPPADVDYMNIYNDLPK